MAEVERLASSGRVAPWPISFHDVLAAERRIRLHVPPTPLRRYAPLDALLGWGIEAGIKHENDNPTGSFKARNALSAMTRLTAEQSRRGAVAATRGNHGLGVAFAGALLGNRGHDLRADWQQPREERGDAGLRRDARRGRADYDDAVDVAQRLVAERGLHLLHSTNEPDVIAGAATITLEVLREQPRLDAMVVAVGGGSQAVGALTAARTLRPDLEVYAVQAAGALATHDSWHAGRPVREGIRRDVRRWPGDPQCVPDDLRAVA